MIHVEPEGPGGNDISNEVVNSPELRVSQLLRTLTQDGASYFQIRFKKDSSERVPASLLSDDGESSVTIEAVDGDYSVGFRNYSIEPAPFVKVRVTLPDAEMTISEMIEQERSLGARKIDPPSTTVETVVDILSFLNNSNKRISEKYGPGVVEIEI